MSESLKLKCCQTPLVGHVLMHTNRGLCLPSPLGTYINASLIMYYLIDCITPTVSSYISSSSPMDSVGINWGRLSWKTRGTNKEEMQEGLKNIVERDRDREKDSERDRETERVNEWVIQVHVLLDRAMIFNRHLYIYMYCSNWSQIDVHWGLIQQIITYKIHVSSMMLLVVIQTLLYIYKYIINYYINLNINELFFSSYINTQIIFVCLRANQSQW